MKFLLSLLALAAPLTGALASDVALESTVLVERSEQQADGTVSMTLEEPTRVVPGDNLLFVLEYHNEGAEPAENFRVVNPLPEAVAFRDTERAGAEFSVDGGEHWGALSALTITGEDGSTRPATRDDVTHVRWILDQAIPAGGEATIEVESVVSSPEPWTAESPSLYTLSIELLVDGGAFARAL